MTPGPNPPQLRRPAPRRGHLFVVAFGLTALAVYGSYVPLDFRDIPFDDAVNTFKTIPGPNWGAAERTDLVFNLLLFVPLGFAWLGVIDLDRQSRLLAVLALPVLCALLAALSLAIEFGQLWTVQRTPSKTDIGAQWIGSAVGMALWLAVGHWLIIKLRDVFRQDEDAPTVKRALQFYTLALVLYSLQPLDVALSPEAMRLKVEAGRVVLRPFSHDYGGLAKFAWQVVVDLALFVPVGMMFRLKGRGTRSIAAAVLLGLTLAAMIEAAQLFIFTRYCDTTDVFVSGLGALAGALAAPLLVNRSPATARRRWSTGRRVLIACVLCALYTLPLVAAFWHPYDVVAEKQAIRESLRSLWGAPFRGYYVGGEFNAMTNIARGLMLFTPIGAVLRWAFGRRPGCAAVLACAALAVPIGLVIEVGQAWFRNKYTDITDLAVYTAGALLGWVVISVLSRDGRVEQVRPRAISHT